MTKARGLVGLDMPTTKIVAAVPDAETGQSQTFSTDGDACWHGRVLRRTAAAGAGGL